MLTCLLESTTGSGIAYPLYDPFIAVKLWEVKYVFSPIPSPVISCSIYSVVITHLIKPSSSVKKGEPKIGLVYVSLIYVIAKGRDVPSEMFTYT